MRDVLFHPLGITLLAGSVLLAGGLRFFEFVPLIGEFSALAPGVLFLGATGYTALVVTLSWPAPENSLPDPQPPEADLADTIKQKLRSKAIRHPATLLPLAVAAVSVSYLALLEPAIGGGLIVRMTGVIGLLTGAGCILWHNLVNRRQRYSGMSRWLTDVSVEAKAEAEKKVLVRLRGVLEEGFPQVGSELGIKALRGLDDEYFKLGLALDSQGRAASVSLAAVPSLARETYHRGLSVLGDVLELMRALDGPTREQFGAEITDLEFEIGSLGSDDGDRTRTLILEDTLASKRQRMVMQEQLRLRADQLLYLANRCEATLNLTRIQVAGIRAGGLESGVDPVVGALEETVRRAKEVQDELQQLGY